MTIYNLKIRGMEYYEQKEDITLMYVPASSFPDGIEAGEKFKNKDG